MFSHFLNNNLFNINFFNNKFSQTKLEIDNNNNLEFIPFDNLGLHSNENYMRFRKRMERVNTADVILKIWIWNMQSLNKKFKERMVKIEFIRNILNTNRVDIVFLIDVNNFLDSLILNGFNKYTDKRNILFVRNDIELTFEVRQNIFFDNFSKLAFMYIIPNVQDLNMVIAFQHFKAKNFAIFGDFNVRSNIDKYNNIDKFFGEDSLQLGLIGATPLKFYTIAGPSDHFSVFYIIKRHIKFRFPIRLKEISIDNTKNEIYQLLRGQIPDFKPKIKVFKTYCRFNDREQVINFMIDEYLKNNVRPIYKKFNYLWKFERKEPFLGPKCPETVEKSFAAHLHALNNKNYLDNKIDNKIKLDFKNTYINVSFSKAITNEYHSLHSICTATRDFLDDKNISDNEKYDCINNIIAIANHFKYNLIAKTFFLIKNKKLADFNDVRVIVIMPSFIKIYEALIYPHIVRYMLSLFGTFTEYQYGGLPFGSTFKAMMKLREAFVNENAMGVVLLDMAKGYDCVNFDLLIRMIADINDVYINYYLYNWCIMAYNLDYDINGNKIRRTRGIAMGLSLSPIIFIFYVHNIIKSYDLSKLVLYIDDIGFVISNKISINNSYNMLSNIINDLKKYDLIINKKKSVVISKNADVINKFKADFQILQSERYLGRRIGINDNGDLVNDDRYFCEYSIRAKCVPNWCIFGIRRLVFITALEAKLRFKLFMWSTNSKIIRSKLWKNSWIYFKSNFGKYSYLQMSFTIFNIFRYFIDTLEIDKLTLDFNSGIDPLILDKLVKEKLEVKNEQITKAINEVNIDWNILNKFSDKWARAKFFLNDIFTKFKINMLNNYKLDKLALGIRIYDNIENITSSRFFKNFSFFQDLFFNHSTRKKNKQLFIFQILQNLSNYFNLLASKNYDWKFTINQFDIKFDMEYEVPVNYNDSIIWDNYVADMYYKFWPIGDTLIKLDKLYEERNSIKNRDENLWYAFLNCYKSLFHVCTVTEIIYCNGSLNGCSPEELELHFFIKKCNLNDLSDKVFNCLNTEDIILDNDLRMY